MLNIKSTARAPVLHTKNPLKHLLEGIIVRPQGFEPWTH